MLINLLQKIFKRKLEVSSPKLESSGIPPRGGFFSTEYSFFDDVVFENQKAAEQAVRMSLKRPAQVAPIQTMARSGATMDDDGDDPGVKQFVDGFGLIPAAQALWYGSQSFIGYQLCAIMAQHWLVDKCCTMPAKDATRKGFDITVNDGTEVPSKILDRMRELDKRYKIMKNVKEFIRMGRIFGIRVAIFEIESDDPDFYYKPFNPESVKPGSYKGISQIDPYWIIGQLDSDAASNPASIHFYEPTWWQVGARRIHKSHLVIFRTGELPDILKPTYLWGGVSLPQKIYERVYAAERTANEAPLLALTKRTDVIQTDLTQAASEGVNFFKKFTAWVQNRNNYGIKVIDKESEDMKQFDTSLADLDAVIMTQYQLVAAAADVPAVKLLGTSPKGFNTTGEFEEASYHETLESLQADEVTDLVEGHHLRMILSEIVPSFKYFTTCIKWKSLDALTAKEEAEINQIKGVTDEVLKRAGALDENDIRDRLIADPSSGYSGIESGAPEPIEEEPDGNGEESGEFGEKREPKEEKNYAEIRTE